MTSSPVQQSVSSQPGAMAGPSTPTAVEQNHSRNGEQSKRPGGWVRKLRKAEEEAAFWRDQALSGRKPEQPEEIRVLQSLVDSLRKQIQIQERYIARLTNGR